MSALLIVAGVLVLVITYLVVTFVPFGKVVESERHGGEIAADVLKAHGVKFIFTLVRFSHCAGCTLSNG